MENTETFQVILLGVVFDPKTRKFLIGKRKRDTDTPELKWAFPGGRLTSNEELNETLKKKIKEKTGLDVKNLGAVFSKTHPEKKEKLSIYYLCEAIGGKEEAGGDFEELKWVAPRELETHFTTSFHPVLKEYIMNIS